MGTCKDSFYVPNGGEGTISPVPTSHWNAPTVNPGAAQWWTMNQPILRRMFCFYQGALSQRGVGGPTHFPHTPLLLLLCSPFSANNFPFSHTAIIQPGCFQTCFHNIYRHTIRHSESNKWCLKALKTGWTRVSVASVSLCLNPLHPLPRTCGRCASSRAERAPLQPLQQNRPIPPSSSGFAPRGRLAGLRSRHRFTE